MLALTQRVDIDQVVRNSFKDYHVKGFDYLCLRRSDAATDKLYFFDGDFSRMPEVVNPHDHRYDFDTTVVCGASQNVWFQECGPDDRGAKRFNRFAYRTPLNGGNGFCFDGETNLREYDRITRRAGESYHMQADELHTIRIIANETVLFLRQYADVVPLDAATQTFTQGDAPSLDGLYARFTADEVVARLTNFEERTGYRFLMQECA
jgi:hypothetical protein